MDTIVVQLLSFQVAALAVTLGLLWNIHRDVGSLRQDVKKDMADLRQDVKKDMSGLRQDVKKDMSGLRQDVKKDMSGLRQEFGRDISEIRKDTAGLRERMVKVESLLESFIGRPKEAPS